VTGIVNISPEEYEAMPSRFDGEWLRGNVPSVAESMDRFIDKRCRDRLSVLSVHFARLRVCDVPGRAHRAERLATREMLDRYELYIYKQWLRVYMRSKMIKHNKDLLGPSTTRSRSSTSCTSIEGVVEPSAFGHGDDAALRFRHAFAIATRWASVGWVWSRT
jgi:hypothetical protein